MTRSNCLNRVICIFSVILAGAFAPPLCAVDPDLLAGLKARAIGPAAMSGRITAIDAVVSDPNRIVIGVATGGVWMSDNGGLTWRAVFDEQDYASIGAVAINQKNPDIIWVGTGEGNTRNSTSIGGGVYKSVDGGRTWRNMGLESSERIRRIALHPDDSGVAYVGALGALWSPNTERGVYRTTDGGESWERVLYVNDSTGATDVKMDPSNPNKLFAAMWQFRRWPYHFKSGGPGSGLYVSHDGGDSWQQRTQEDGLPTGELGRIAISIAPADPGRVYALVEAQESALLRSDDGGVSWATVNQEYNVADRPFYYTEVIADPHNPDRVYNMATRLRVSIDGGRNFEYNSVIDCCMPGNTIHIDNHAFWINPADPRHLIIGNDGGIAISRDRGETWRFVRNLPLAQYYHIAVDNEHPYNVYGGLQDNGSWRGPAEIWEPAGIRNLHWQEVGFGDGFDTIPDPENARAGYAMSQGGHLQRYDLDRGQQKLIRPAPPEPGVELRFNWNAGFEQDPFDPATIYYGSQFLHKSTDRGLSWTVISGDLTSNNPDWQTFHSSGGLTPDVTAAENYTTIVAVAASRLERGLVWVGTDDGRVHVTRDGGENWDRIDGRARGVPAGAWVPMIAPSPHEPGTAFVVFDDHRRGDMSPYVYRADDFGRRWTRLSPDGLAGYALSVLQDTVEPRLLFVGTELGLYFSLDGGQSWTRFSAGVPTVSVMDMAIQERESDLVLGTHGRSVFVIDDYSALRGLTEDDFGARLNIRSATPGQQYDADPTSSTRFTGSSEYRGPNEPYGVMVTFIASGGDLPHPKAERERERKISRRAAGQADTGQGESNKGKNVPPRVKVRVSNAAGEVIRSFEQEVHQGINRLTWGMQIDGVRQPPGTEEKDRKEFPTGAEVVPGQYRIELELDGETAAIDAEVLADPRHQVSEADYAARFAALRDLQDLEEAHVSALERIDRTRNDVQTIKTLIEARQGAEPDSGLEDLLKQADEVAEGLGLLEQRFRTPPRTTGIVYSADKVANRLALARSYVESARHAPGPTAQAFVEQARSTLAQALNSLNGFLAQDVHALRTALADAGISLLSPADPLDLPK